MFIKSNCHFLEHAKDALELSKMQEGTRQQEYMVKVKEYEAHIEQAKVEQKKVDYEERRKTMIVSNYKNYVIATITSYLF